MEDKDYIYVYDENGRAKKMELILAMNSEDGKEQYIVYKEINKVVPVYMAKIKLGERLIDLDTNLSLEEKRLISEKLKQKVVGEKDE